MSKRNKRRSLATNAERMYERVFKKKGVRSIVQYTTPTFKNPTDDLLDTIKYETYVWSVGDRFWRLADKFYGDKNYWYIIARFNRKPTEAHVKVGDEIRIPINLGQAIEVLG